MAHPPQRLLSLPSKLLREIVAPLSPADLRRLHQVNHLVLEFIVDYSKPSSVGLADLPNTLVLEVVAHFDQQGSKLIRTDELPVLHSRHERYPGSGSAHKGDQAARNEYSMPEGKDVIASGDQIQDTAMLAPTTRAIISEEQAKLQTNAASPPRLHPQHANSKLDSIVPTKSVWANASSKIRAAPTVEEQVSMEKSIICPQPTKRTPSPHRYRVGIPFGYQRSKVTGQRLRRDTFEAGQ
ncbi:hypothetical protein BKA58DRAFT_400804 [Alternaria rosae]|uniref:uncharacterized protein n=1 Tax=Alternaria rosae TaxID=1187941 RepID=UPI001E8CFD9D|nr:uncharacterized protein BKA58DRAFT_400804 [Alternaria rosae]KAH6872588.1 hypothetical protein BKA58DRAFT_400804 [Alternaria rosae]